MRTRSRADFARSAAGRCFGSRACAAPTRSWSRRAEAFGNHASGDQPARQLAARDSPATSNRQAPPTFPKLRYSGQGRQPRRVMAAFAERFGEDSAEVEVLRLLGLFDRPATKGAIDALREPPSIPGLTDHLSGLGRSQSWLRLLERLRATRAWSRQRATTRRTRLDAHPLVREHFGEELREKHPEAWRAGHARLYEHFKALPEKHQPDTLEEMAPLFQAVFHGCQAGRHQEALDEVYWARISRGEKVLRYQEARRVRRRSGGAGRLLRSAVGAAVGVTHRGGSSVRPEPGRLST